MRLDLNPSLSLLSGVLGNLLGLGDLAVINVFVSFRQCPDRVEAPAASTLDENSHSKTVAHGEYLILVADECEHHPGEEVVVDVEIAVRAQSLRVPDDKADENGRPDSISVHDMAGMKSLEIEVQD